VVSVFLLSVGAMVYGLHQRNAAAIHAMTPYLKQLLNTNDVFDANRQLNSLLSSGVYSGYWLHDAASGNLITSNASDTARLNASVAGLGASWKIGFFNARPEIIATFPVGADYRLTVTSQIPLLPVAAVFVLLAASCCGFYFVMRRKMLGFASDISKPITDFAIALKTFDASGNTVFETPESASRFAELSDMGLQFGELIKRLQASEEGRRMFEKDAALATQARETAHNLKSPVLALAIATKTFSDMPENSRVIIQSAINSISDITNTLKAKYDELNPQSASSMSDFYKSAANNPFSSLGSRTGTHLLSSLIEDVISLCRMQHRSRAGVKIESCLEASAYGIFSKIDPVEFKNVLSNLITNSAEAIADKGLITVEMNPLPGGFAEIIVSDNGAGIPADILPRLMRKDASFGKAGGSGIGLYHARKVIEAWGGTIRLDSTLGHGTKVFVLLPRCDAPAWFLQELRIEPGTDVVIVDDDPSIHEVWKSKLGAEAALGRLRLHHFKSPDALAEWHNSGAKAADPDSTRRLFLVDYEFIGHTSNGLDVIDRLGIQRDAVLVTSHYDDRDVVEGCMDAGVRLLPKGLAGWVKWNSIE